MASHSTQLSSDDSSSICANRDRPFVLAATIIASAIAFIDGAVVTIALPIMRDELGASYQQLQWVTNAYTLFLGALILVGGAAGDVFGRRKVFLAGVFVFAASSVLCAIAPSAEILIGGRALKGVGAALMVPQSLAIISASFPKAERGGAIGTWAAISAITTALGPAIGGLLIDAWSWRAAFWINIPLTAIVVFLTVRHVPESRNANRPDHIDWMGAVLVALGCGGLTYGLTLFSSEQSGAYALSVALIFVGILTLIAFVLFERRQSNALMPPELFSNRAFLGANLITLFLYGALSGSLFLLPFVLIEKWQLSATEVGLIMLPFGLIIGVLSQFSGKLADHYGPRPLLMAGSAIYTVALVVMALVSSNLWIGIFIPLCTMAIGMGLVVSPLTTAVMNSVSDEQSGVASGVNNAASRLSGLFAITIVGLITSVVYRIAAGDTGDGQFGQLPPPDSANFELQLSAFDQAFTAGLIFGALLAALSTLIAFLAIPKSAQ